MNSPSPEQPDKRRSADADPCEFGCSTATCNCDELKSLEQFGQWLDQQLESLVRDCVEWETRGSNRKYFGRQ